MFANNSTDAPPAGDWRAHNLSQKYEMSRYNDKSTNKNLPFGWEGIVPFIVEILDINQISVTLH